LRQRFEVRVLQGRDLGDAQRARIFDFADNWDAYRDILCLDKNPEPAEINDVADSAFVDQVPPERSCVSGEHQATGDDHRKTTTGPKQRCALLKEVDEKVRAALVRNVLLGEILLRLDKRLLPHIRRIADDGVEAAAGLGDVLAEDVGEFGFPVERIDAAEFGGVDGAGELAVEVVGPDECRRSSRAR